MDLPELFVTGVDERGHFTFKRWGPPPVQDFATPADLARLIAAFRTWVKASPEPGFLPITEQGAISEEGLRRLLLLAYQASFYTDERRGTQGRLFVPDVDGQVHPVHINHLFTVAKPLFEPRIISQLAPALISEDSALVIQETEGELACIGISLLDAADASRPLLGMPRGWTRSVGGLQVQIRGPGELRVSEGRVEYTLRANRILVQASGEDVSAAQHALRQSEHNLRVALVMLKRKVSAAKARKLLKRYGGSLRRALGE